ncbi:cytochrome-c peroxidase [Polyangium sorediatum]|nr:cytochrome c peroxidase [Polyangium sorediatum]
MRKTTTTGLITLICMAALAACEGPAAETPDPIDPPPTTDDDGLDLPATPYNYAAIELPAHFQGPLAQDQDNTPANNPITNDGATLGRVLFYDTALSKNGAVACASCHKQKDAFSDTARLSLGFEGGETGRNSMSVVDARFYRNGRFFWDERAATLEDQVLRPIQDPVEMGLTLDELVTNVSAQTYYPKLFEQAFGDPTITSDRISRALAQFVRSIVSYRSRFDEGIEAVGGDIQANFPTFTPEENAGKALFLGPAGGCAACHLDEGPPHPPPRRNNAFFYIAIPTNNGLDATTDGDDNGLGEITGNPQDNGRFKSPSLRNVALTGPYMHDGRFETLDQVVEHYNAGVKPHPNLDPRLRIQGSTEPRKLNLTPDQKASLVAFLKTLTDEKLLADPMYADPFEKAAP